MSRRRRNSEERDWFPEGSRPSRRDSLNGAREGGIGGAREFKQEFRPGDWECDSCQAHNFARRDSCFKCDRGREGRRSRSRSRSPVGRRRRSPIYRDYRDPPNYSYKEGDWQCAKCSFDNYARRTRCFKCDRVKSDRGGQRGRSASNYREGDWFCRGCGKDNFASRTECFRCGQRK